MQHAFTTAETLSTARRFWQMSLVRGILAIIVGLVILLWPHLAFSLFFTIFGAFAIVEGVCLIASGYLQRHKGSANNLAYQQPAFYQSSATYQRPTTATSSASTTAPQSTPSKGDTTYQKSEAARAAAAERAASFEPDATLEETVSERTGTTYQQATTAGTSYQARAEEPAAAYRTGAAYQPSIGRSLIGEGSTVQMIAGVLSVICGILCFALPGVVGALVVYAVAAWAMFHGISSLMQAHERGWIMGAIGVMSLILSLFLFIDPIGAIRGFLWGVGLFALIAGVMLVARALQHNLAAAHANPTLEPTY